MRKDDERHCCNLNCCCKMDPFETAREINQRQETTLKAVEAGERI